MADSVVCSHNEWDPLEEVVVGTVRGARIPVAGADLHAIEYADLPIGEIPSGPFDDRVVNETEAELDALCAALTGLGVVVRRPAPRDLAARIGTPDWSTDGYHDYCPRDGLLVVGDTIVETPMVLRSRLFESLAYRELLLEYFAGGARWVAAPRPRLLDTLYDDGGPARSRLGEAEPCFDAANIVRLGRDLLYLVSDSGNEIGARWLQRLLPDHRVHLCRDIYARTHVDSTIVPLRPGLVLLNPERVTSANLPAPLRDWEIIWCPELVDIGFVGDRPRASVWIGMNLLMVNPELAVVDGRQRALIAELERHGVDVLPMRLTHARTLAGGFHCATLDVRRRGSRADHS